MKKQLLKSALIAVAGVGLMAGSAMANAIVTGPWADYEYYQKTSLDNNGYAGQFVQNGETYTFYFDLAFLNNGSTNSQLTRETDVQGYASYLTPIDKIWTGIALLSADDEWEQFDLYVDAYINNTQYHLTDYAFTLGNDGNSDIARITIQWSGQLLDAWKIDPYGIVTMNITTFYTGGGYNDFNLLEVGTGVTPVPEPATMLLFGTGLAGLAGIARRRKAN